MKRRIPVVALLMAVLLVGVFAGPATAQDPLKVPLAVDYWYFGLDLPPIPIGEMVEFVEIQGQPVIGWKERIRDGFVKRHYIFRGVRIRFDEGGATPYRDPMIGDIGVVTGYDDYRDVSGQFGSDGMVDYMVISAPRETMATSQPVNLRYIRMDNQPIPVGEIVEYSTDQSGQLLLVWRQRQGIRTVVHRYLLSGVKQHFMNWRPSRSPVDYVQPLSGSVGILLNYGDYRDATGIYVSDGIIDDVSIDAYREWTPQEEALLKILQQFYREMVEEGLFIIPSLLGDCPPSRYALDGRALVSGPYGESYHVPQEGGELTVVHEPRSCGDFPKTRFEWKAYVKPGDAVLGMGQNGVFPLVESKPWSFCARLETMVPQWQPKLAYPELQGPCRLENRFSQSTRAQLARMGFRNAGERTGDDHPAGLTPFVWMGQERVTLELPPHHWVEVKDIGLEGGSKYIVSVGYDIWARYFPALNMVGGRSGDTDVPWLRWEAPLIFVSRDDLYKGYAGFDWSKYPVYRVVRSGWLRATIHKLVIEK